ncbi:hypothetical protein BU24DRAFT_450068 [Aaosphaeria arxii CBS 175.79]|uniref:Low temperature requirement A n=1 Tax=Aaosphaeria arxii CBS 175.79 TaxID=1450172 RepID=A0A6A5XRE9_9PLEO|nr:uncharacterized protein BU24DRAFT_450068 [Aaosphaeria arxii CBS 175.79]KAF2015331.1 hypothetical protein BU24DRAFT_450068 [Aaosphaeria arxii CBS 175.79]
MGHETHHSEARKSLGIFASPLQHADHSHKDSASSDEENQKSTNTDANHVPFNNTDCDLHDSPSFHRHAEATTAELFYDLFFVANLTTFTAMLDINSSKTLTAYIGFFSLLWLTWYQTSLYDVRFSSDSLFERIAKGLHFGVMVGFAVIGPQWKPGEEIYDYKIYRAFGFILMVSRLTLFCQYGVTLFYSRVYKKTIVPLAIIMASTLIAAILYGALTAVFPHTKEVLNTETGLLEGVYQKSNAYIAWYVIGIIETILTVSISCIWRLISFKGTHMVQRMSLLTLIILGEGIIVICKAISKIVKLEYLWSAAVIGQIIAAILIIYFLYMLYFDRLQEEHFGTIKQQLWSFVHFPLHTGIVLVLQGVSHLIIWRQAIEALNDVNSRWMDVQTNLNNHVYENGTVYAQAFYDVSKYNVFDYVPKGMDVGHALEVASEAATNMAEGYDNLIASSTNTTAESQLVDGINTLIASTADVLFTSLGIEAPKMDKGGEEKKLDFDTTFNQYGKVFNLVVEYVFVTAGLSLLFITICGFLSLPKSGRRMSEYIRLGANAAFSVGLCLITLLRYNDTSLSNFMMSAWMIPLICIVYFLCVLGNHLRLPGKKTH